MTLCGAAGVRRLAVMTLCGAAGVRRLTVMTLCGAAGVKMRACHAAERVEQLDGLSAAGQVLQRKGTTVARQIEPQLWRGEEAIDEGHPRVGPVGHERCGRLVRAREEHCFGARVYHSRHTQLEEYEGPTRIFCALAPPN